MAAELYHGDFREAQIEPESIDLILTDPPYGKKYMYLWDALGALSQRVLKPGGWLIAYAGQSHLDEEM
ncbi:MAG: class I SAM-dependent methyltransferase, partial [Nitrososphaerota archaeon]|nr:class I SAM-dependent methyltransferase [Nitrososphaerota archaeon]